MVCPLTLPPGIFRALDHSLDLVSPFAPRKACHHACFSIASHARCDLYPWGQSFQVILLYPCRKLIDFFVEGLLLYFLLTNVIRTPLMLKRVVWVLLISGALIGGLSLYQHGHTNV